MAERLYRSREDTVIGGVAGGVAEALDVDPSIVRVVWVLLAFLTGGIAALVYLIMLIVVPQAHEGEAPDASGVPPVASAGITPEPAAAPRVTGRTRTRRTTGGGGLVFGAILILVGAYFLVREYVPAIDLDVVWPVAVIVIGGLLVLTALRPRGRSEG